MADTLETGILWGDADNSGSIKAEDANIASNWATWILGHTSSDSLPEGHDATWFKVLSCDITGHGTITANDAQYILNYATLVLANKTTPFEVLLI